MQAIHNIGDLVAVAVGEGWAELEVKVLVTVFVFTTPEELSSGLARPAEAFILSCASALSFNQSLKSTKVGRLQFFFTVCIDHASFMFGGNF